MKVVTYCITIPLFSFLTACGSERKSPTKPMSSSLADLPAPSISVVPDPPKPVAVEPPPSGPILANFSCTVTATTSVTEISSAGDRPRIAVTATNKGNETWMAMIADRPARNLVNIGYHWVDAQGNETEGTRSAFSQDIKPGDTGTVSMKLIEMPAGFGEYTLRIEPIQEGVGWFSKKGGCKTEVKIKLTR